MQLPSSRGNFSCLSAVFKCSIRVKCLSEVLEIADLQKHMLQADPLLQTPPRTAASQAKDEAATLLAPGLEPEPSLSSPALPVAVGSARTHEGHPMQLHNSRADGAEASERIRSLDAAGAQVQQEQQQRQEVQQQVELVPGVWQTQGVEARVTAGTRARALSASLAFPGGLHSQEQAGDFRAAVAVGGSAGLGTGTQPMARPSTAAPATGRQDHGTPASVSALDELLAGSDRDDVSHKIGLEDGGGAGASAGGVQLPPAFLAESVYDGVRAKLRRLQDDVRDRDVAIEALHKVGRAGRA